ncbi:ATP-binding protein [Candidatus Woesearchaeota archaeon]|nr:ATP-binding protein [Candidatus Woesearchaeota archaeon]MBT6519545.1 ATP-binding protein [Candidatus Woesearchaeota archaeon]MBT7367710.1 ATP-binding protein [Candidatus Woesearchaeota archaeon]
MFEIKKYVLTGGPGTGKSSIIEELKKRGECVIPEAAEEYIKLKQAQGVNEPWLEDDFQIQILKIQIDYERKIPLGVSRVFIDRGLLDGLAYVKMGTWQYKEIKAESEKIHYAGVFLIDQLGHTKKTEVRRENEDEALKIGNKIKQIYVDFGYDLVKIGFGTIEERANRVLDHLS